MAIVSTCRSNSGGKQSADSGWAAASNLAQVASKCASLDKGERTPGSAARLLASHSHNRSATLARPGPTQFPCLALHRTWNPTPCLRRLRGRYPRGSVKRKSSRARQLRQPLRERPAGRLDASTFIFALQRKRASTLEFKPCRCSGAGGAGTSFASVISHRGDHGRPRDTDGTSALLRCSPPRRAAKTALPGPKGFRGADEVSAPPGALGVRRWRMMADAAGAAGHGRGAGRAGAGAWPCCPAAVSQAGGGGGRGPRPRRHGGRVPGGVARGARNGDRRGCVYSSTSLGL